MFAFDMLFPSFFSTIVFQCNMSFCSLVFSLNPLNSVLSPKLMFLDEVELEEWVKDNDLKLVLKEDLSFCAALTLDLIQEDGPR